MIKGLIFDYGGTLDSRGIHWSEVIWDGYREAAVPVTKEQFREAYVYAERELARTRHILPHHTFRDLLDIKMRIELRYLAEQGLFTVRQADQWVPVIAGYCYRFAKNCVEEARMVLALLYNEYPIVLVSNFYGNIEAVLNDFGIAKYFDKIVESAVVGVRKPDPKIFTLGVEALGLKPEEVLVVGDSYTKDIEPALKAGCHAVWLKGKGWTDKEDAIEYPHTIRKLGELLDSSILKN